MAVLPKITNGHITNFSELTLRRKKVKMKTLKQSIVILTIFFLFPIAYCLAEETPKKDEPFVLDEVVVTATKTEREVKDVSTNMTVITKEDIKKYKPTDLFDLLRHVSGLNLGQASSRSAYIAGFRGMQPSGKAINLMLNGFEMNNVANWMAPLNIIPYNIERIEIIKSPSSSLYGANGVGGIINVITQKPTKPFEGEASFSYGSFDRWEPHANIGGLLENGFSYGLNAWYLDSNGYRDNQYNRNLVVNPRLGYTGDRIDFEIIANIKDIDDGYPGGLPLDSYKDNPKRASQPEEYGKGHAESNTFGGKLNFTVSENSILSFKASYSTLSNWMVNGGTYSEVDDSDNWTAETNYQYDFSIGNIKNSLLAGLEYRDLLFKIGLRPDDNHPQVWNMRAKIDEKIWGLFIQDEIRPAKKLSVNLGVRYDEISTDYVHATEANSYDKIHHKWSPRFGFTFDLYPSVNIFGNYSHGIRSVSLTQYPPALRENLEPEKLESFELGTRGAITESISYNLAGFQILTKDIIISTGGQFDFENAGEARSRGFEVGVESKFPLGFYVAFDYTYLESKFSDYKTATANYDDKRVPLVPRHILGSTFGWVNDNYGRLDISARFVDDKFIDSANTRKLDDYFVADIKYTYKYKTLGCSLAVNNLFDEKYAEFGAMSGGSYQAGPVAYPAEGRSVVGTISYTF